MFKMWTSIRDYISIGLLILVVVCWVGWKDSQSKLDAEIMGRANDRLSYEKAQAEAEALAYKAKVEQEKKDALKAKKSDEDYIDLLRKYNASIVRYKASQSVPQGSSLPGPAEATESSDRPGEGAGIFISLDDASVCAENTARIKTVQEWATNPTPE